VNSAEKVPKIRTKTAREIERWLRWTKRQNKIPEFSSTPEIATDENVSSTWFSKNTNPRRKARKYPSRVARMWESDRANELAVRIPIFARSTSKLPLVRSDSNILVKNHKKSMFSVGKALERLTPARILPFLTHF
jgi:hypothetical protein